MKVTEARSNPEGWRYQHVQAIIIAIDQYAEAATGNREFFLNRPPGVRRVMCHSLGQRALPS